MAHFARVVDGVVTRVIVADAEFIENFESDQPGEWIQTSYNTHGGVHADGGVPLRKNFAGIGFTYDQQRDAFIPPKPFPSWVLDEDSCLWEAPVPMPSDGDNYKWDEATKTWAAVVVE